MLAVVLVGVGAAIAIPRLHAGSGVSLADVKRGDLVLLHASTPEQRFAVLSRRHTNKCSLTPESIESIAVRGRLQGSCCRPMVFDRYVEQLRRLKRYGAVAEIPADPYDVPLGLAKRLIAYDRTITLSPAQQKTYDHATTLSHEHGPCCCHCWRWTAFGGQAKYLIARRGYTAQQIAGVWDLEDGCGGGAA